MIRKRPTDTFQMAPTSPWTLGNRRLEADLGGPVAWDGRIRARRGRGQAAERFIP